MNKDRDFCNIFVILVILLLSPLFITTILVISLIQISYDQRKF